MAYIQVFVIFHRLKWSTLNKLQLNKIKNESFVPWIVHWQKNFLKYYLCCLSLKTLYALYYMKNWNSKYWLCVIIMSRTCLRVNLHSILAWRCDIWRLSNKNGIRTHNHLVCIRKLNHLASLSKWLSVRLQTTRLWVEMSYKYCWPNLPHDSTYTTDLLNNTNYVKKRKIAGTVKKKKIILCIRKLHISLSFSCSSVIFKYVLLITSGAMNAGVPIKITQ